MLIKILRVHCTHINIVRINSTRILAVSFLIFLLLERNERKVVLTISQFSRWLPSARRESSRNRTSAFTETPLVRYRVQRFTMLGISFACRGERAGNVGFRCAEETREKEKFRRVAERWHNPRRIFPDVFVHVYFLASRWHDKRPSDVRRGFATSTLEEMGTSKTGN